MFPWNIRSIPAVGEPKVPDLPANWLNSPEIMATLAHTIQFRGKHPRDPALPFLSKDLNVFSNILPWLKFNPFHGYLLFFNLISVAFGGIGGLLMGASILSAVELIYYFTIRFWVYMRNHFGKVKTSKAKEISPPSPRVIFPGTSGILVGKY